MSVTAIARTFPTPQSPRRDPFVITIKGVDYLQYQRVLPVSPFASGDFGLIFIPSVLHIMPVLQCSAGRQGTKTPGLTGPRGHCP